MTTPPAAWYDDPESPAHHRFWDGANWTEHRSPKAVIEPISTKRSDSAWNIFPDTFNAIGATWRQLMVISTANVVMGAVFLIVAYATVNAVFDGELGEMIDRLNDGSRSAADDAYFDRLKVSFPGPMLWVAVPVAGVWFAVGSLVSAALQRTLAASMQGHAIEPHHALQGASARRGRVLIGSLVIVALVVAMLVLAGFSLVAFLLALPVFIFAAPYALATYPAIAVAPRDQRPIAQARKLLKGRWLAAARQCLVYAVLWFVTVFCGMLTVQFFATNLWAAIIGLAVTMLVQNIVLSAGLVALWIGSGGPLDSDLIPRAADSPT